MHPALNTHFITVACALLTISHSLHSPLCLRSFQKLIFNTAAKIFSATSRITTQGEGVGFLNPLLAMAQLVNVAAPGSEPCLQGEVLEDARLLVPALADKRGEQADAAWHGSWQALHDDVCCTVCLVRFIDN